MGNFIVFDGGGSKLSAVMFDDHYDMLASAQCDGVNLSNRSVQEVDENISCCVDALFRYKPVHQIERIYGWFLFHEEPYMKSVKRYAECSGLTVISEGELGVYACGISSDAICVLSGTGSGVFYVSGGKLKDWVGGWGALLGDEGSGFDIGKRVVKAVIAYEEKTGNPTMLYNMLMERYHAQTARNVVNNIFSKKSATAEFASLTYVASKAAKMGDEVAIGIFETAGKELGKQVVLLLEKNKIPSNLPVCITGGAFCAHDALLGGLIKFLNEYNAELRVVKPIFEPVIGGILYCMKERNGIVNKSDIAMLKTKYSNYCIG